MMYFLLACVTAYLCANVLDQIARSPYVSGEWKERGVSFVHAVMQVVLLSPLILFNLPFFALRSGQEMVEYDLGGAHYCCVLAAHWIFLYYMYLEFRYARLRNDEVVHHSVNMLAIASSLWIGVSYLSAVGLFAELSTVFLHLRKLARKYPSIDYAFVGTFFATRICMNTYVFFFCLPYLSWLSFLFWSVNLSMNYRWWRKILQRVRRGASTPSS